LVKKGTVFVKVWESTVYGVNRDANYMYTIL